MAQSLRLQVARRNLKKTANAGRRMEIAPYGGNLFDPFGNVYVRQLGGSSGIRHVPSPIPIETGKNVYVGAYRIVVVKIGSDGREYITGNDSDDLKYAGINARQLNANDPAARFKTAESLSNLQSYPTGSDGTVRVMPGIYRKPSGQYGIFEGELNIDLLTSYTPSAGNQHIVALWLNTDTNAVTITTSEELSSATDLKLNPATALTYINQAADSAPANRVGITAYLIDSEDTVISEANKFHDLRGLIESWSANNRGYEPLTNGDSASPELVFSNGDVIMVQMQAA
jgi:hypothetical protein